MQLEFKPQELNFLSVFFSDENKNCGLKLQFAGKIYTPTNYALLCQLIPPNQPAAEFSRGGGGVGVAAESKTGYTNTPIISQYFKERSLCIFVEALNLQHLFLGDSCVTLASLIHGNVSCSGYNTENTCLFHCDPGFNLIGSNKRTCLSTSQWSGSYPRCDSKETLLAKNFDQEKINQSQDRQLFSKHYVNSRLPY